MREFFLNGVELHIPKDCLSEPLITAIEQGRYEGQEAYALKKNLVSGDVVLDIGAGAGYLSALTAEIVGAEHVTAVEAGPRMMSALRRNLDGNFAEKARVIHGAVVPDKYDGETVGFRSRQAFWASEIANDGADEGNVTQVPALKIGELLRAHTPSVVVMDIEGGEAALCDTVWPHHVRLVVMEIHCKKYTHDVVKQIFDGFSKSGMTYLPWGSRGETVVFQRI